MTEQHRSSIEALLAAQQAYWQQLTSAETNASTQWAKSLTQHQQELRQKAPQQFAQLMDILTAQANNFSEYGETLLKQHQSGQTLDTDAAIKQFQDYMQQQTTDCLIKQWQIPEQFSALFKSHSKSNSFRDDLLFENPFINGMKSLLDTPVAGVNQAQQQQIQDAIKLTLDYQEALREYTEHYNGISEQAASALLIALQDDGKEIEGLQQLHDLWVNAYEKAYADAIATTAYQQSHGRISNALMRLRKFSQDFRDEQFQLIGLATRQGLDTALERQHQLRKDMRHNQRELAQVKEQLPELNQAALITTIEALRQEVDSLKQQVALLQQKAQPKAGDH